MNKTLKKSSSLPPVEIAPTRDGYGKALVSLSKNDDRIVVVTGDLTESTRAHWFAKEHPDRLIQLGVAEQNMMGVAAGLALAGKIPFVSSYAVFSPGRNWDQLRVSVCYANANVKIVGAHTGLSVGPDGATHQALEDLSLVRVLPQMTVLVPCDVHEARKITIAAARHQGPVYIRLTREKTPIITKPSTPFAIGKAHILRRGTDATIVACGPLVAEALTAASTLAQRGISVEVINNPSIKPLDTKTLLTSISKTGCVVTVEEHQIYGGLGSAIAEFVGEHRPVPLERIGVRDSFGESGTPTELLEKYHLTAPWIAAAITRVIRRKP